MYLTQMNIQENAVDWPPKLIDINIQFQAITRTNLCKNNQTIWLATLVENPTEESSWIYFFSKNKNELFSKGFFRYKTLVGFISIPPKLVLDNSEIIEYEKKYETIILDIFQRVSTTLLKKTFIISCLIIILQPFGDGNHRTAEEYFKLVTFNSGNIITLFPPHSRINENIQRINIDYSYICDNPLVLYDIIQNISDIFEKNKKYWMNSIDT